MQTDLGTTSGYGQVIELQNPFNATRTTAQLISIGVDSTGAYRGRSGGAGIALTTSFTGFTAYAGSGNISGKVSVYGYNL